MRLPRAFTALGRPHPKRWAPFEKACSRDPIREVLFHPYFRRLQDGTPVVEACDSYVFVRIPVEADPEDVEGFIPVESLKVSRAGVGEGERHVFRRPTPGDWPNTDKIVAGATSVEEPLFAINAAYLARAAEALGCERVIVSWRPGAGPDTPIVLRPIPPADDGRFALLMTVRLPPPSEG